MVEREVDPREGLKERLPSGNIPGVSHKFGIHRKLNVTDFRWRSDEEDPIPSYATLNEDVLPGVHEVQPSTAIEFEIPIGNPEATYESSPAVGTTKGL
ncbi:hypothetical protein L202_08412 [Cryptococcus amylolentus CBS 6039]|uniref:Uncharacterized protein n=2 Tax=Cryptococcus amylolentus TaxID=104669 RepID=A0A1E3H9P3_9TREE|nr:hypothetical protein L202_08412 [Cryptococcus amylolentus CBS 6039]ODN73014.1 hypothetical protein L202_08412 [Cryptococcus amylolentus CBS 6039]ODN98170.1 hypothetical protein I350_07816 [Cryptococcus amylolentus CBS 6273]